MKNFVSIMVALYLAATPVYAENHTKGMPDEAAMKRMQEMSTPGAQHKVLDAMVGDWNYTITFRMSSDSPAETYTGATANKWILGGRFLQQMVSGTLDMDKDGKPENFEGISLLGHDNIKGVYNDMWVDNMGTGMMTSTGKYDAATKTLKTGGVFSCPMKGGETKFKAELHFIDADHYTYTMYVLDTPDKPYKSMEIQYTRKK